jgi:hypothetical protein
MIIFLNATVMTDDILLQLLEKKISEDLKCLNNEKKIVNVII